MALTKTTFSMLDGEIINAADYGLKFDGLVGSATANSAALLDALTAAAGKTLYINGNGTAYINAVSQTTSSNIKIVGSNGGLLKWSGAGSSAILSFGSNSVGVNNITIDGLNLDINAAADYTSGLSFRNSTNITVINCRFLNSGLITPGWTLTGFIARGTSRLLVSGNFADKCQIKCAGESTLGIGKDIEIVNNTSENGFFHAISCVATTNTTLENVLIANNTLRGPYGNAIMCGQDGQGGTGVTLRNISVCNNLIYNPQSEDSAGIAFYRGADTQGVSIIGNQIYTLNSGTNTTGISIGDDNASSTVKNVIISKNIVTTRTQFGIEINKNCLDAIVSDNVLIGTRGITALENSKATIANNTIDGDGYNSRAMVIKDCTAQIIGNTVKNCVTGNFAGAIQLEATSGKTLSVNVINNRAYDDQSPKTQQYAVQEIPTGTIVSRFVNNDFSGNGAGEFYNTSPPVYANYSVGTVNPSAPPANSAVVYVDKPGTKVRLMALFPTGVAQQLAIEP